MFTKLTNQCAVISQRRRMIVLLTRGLLTTQFLLTASSLLPFCHWLLWFWYGLYQLSYITMYICKYVLITLEYNLLYMPTNRCISKLLILLASLGQSKAVYVIPCWWQIYMYNLHMRHKIFCVTGSFQSLQLFLVLRAAPVCRLTTLISLRALKK